MIAPLALIGLVSLPIIVAYYMLRLRRRDVPVPGGTAIVWRDKPPAEGVASAATHADQSSNSPAIVLMGRNRRRGCCCSGKKLKCR